MQELNFHGVFVPPLLVWAIVAFFLSSFLGRLFNRVGVYRLVWHPGLFDLAIFVIVWGAISAISYHLAFSNSGPH